MATSSETVVESETTSGDASEAVSVSSSDIVPSVLDRFRAPVQTALMRKQKVRVNRPPHPGTRKKKPSLSTDPKRVSVVQRE